MSRGLFLLASRSEGKLRELRAMFEEAGVEVVDLAMLGVAPSAEEDDLERFSTFEENALAKARFFFARTGIPAIADDSGLEVRALSGGPGVRSKRWSGRADLDGQALDDANNQMLQQALASASDRRARYVCAAALVDREREIVRRGESTGVILTSPRGNGGFGYDPYFLSDDLGVTFGEAASDAKARVSHRGRAFRALIEAVQTGPAVDRLAGEG